MPDLKIHLSLYDDADANADAGECVALLTGVWLGAALILKLKIPPPVGHQTANLHQSDSKQQTIWLLYDFFRDCGGEDGGDGEDGDWFKYFKVGHQTPNQLVITVIVRHGKEFYP